MIQQSQEQQPLNEKYRPKTLDEVIGQDEVVEAIKNVLQAGYTSHFLFVGAPGCGKTTIAQIVANMILEKRQSDSVVDEGAIFMTNASDDRGIDYVRDVIRHKIEQERFFVIILDEADALTYQAQDALRGLMELAGKRGKPFILTGNYENRFSPPILSRCMVFKFRKLSWKEIGFRLLEIAESEGIEVPQTPEYAQFFKFISERADGDLREAIDYLQSAIYVDENGEKRINTSIAVQQQKPKEMLKQFFALVRRGETEGIVSDVRHIEELLQDGKLLPDDIVKTAYEWVIESKLSDEEIRKHIIAIADTEARLKLGTQPIIQFAYLISRIYQNALEANGGAR